MSSSLRPRGQRVQSPGAVNSPTGGNRILTALGRIAPTDEAWLAMQLESVDLATGDVLTGANRPFLHVYFPDTAVLSVISRMRDGREVEVGTVGNEGFGGVSALLGNEPELNETIAQIPGRARRIQVAAFTKGADERPALRALLHRYAHSYFTQVAQTAACNRLHGVDARCARWLLMTQDRVGHADSFPLKQRYLAVMLGARRSGVTVAAGALRDAGLIRYSRGSIRVLDRAGLEAAACECYGIVRRHFDRLLT
jgi:CRP-like cAMP-binding protein